MNKKQKGEACEPLPFETLSGLQFFPVVSIFHVKFFRFPLRFDQKLFCLPYISRFQQFDYIC